MKSRASLVLMEQLVMVLVFALAAALCLRLFAGAYETSEEIARRDEAVVLAQTAAELLKQSGDPDKVLERLDSGGYELKIQKETTEIPNFGQAKITVFQEETELFALTTGWQEVGG